MRKISKVNIINQYTNNGITYGIYKININGEERFVIQNGESVGAISFWLGEPANKCVNEIRDDVKEELFEYLNTIK